MSLFADVAGWAGVVSGLAATLQQLRLLQYLSLSSNWPLPAVTQGSVEVALGSQVVGLSLQQQEAGWRDVVQAVTGLPHLVNLSLTGLPLDALAGVSLASAPHVVKFRLSGPYCDAVLVCLLHSFTGLHHLHLNGAAGVSDAVLAVVARELHCLECLDFARSRGFTAAGIEQLSCLRHLRRIGVAADACEEAAQAVMAACQPVDGIATWGRVGTT